MASPITVAKVQSLFTHNHSILLPVGNGTVRPAVENIVIKPLSTLVNHPKCPNTFKTLHSIAPTSNLIICSGSQDGWYTLILALHDSRTDKLVYDGHLLQHTKRISGIVEDPQNVNIIFTAGHDGNIFEWDIFTKQHTLIYKSRESFNSIACNGPHIAAVTEMANIVLCNRATRKYLTTEKEMHCGQETLYCVFHPIHKSYLFTADTSGTINVFNLAGNADLTGVLKKVKIGEPILFDHFDLAETYTATIQLTDAAHKIHFFGPDCKYMAVLSALTQCVTLVEFDVANEAAEPTVVQTQLGNVLNESLITLLQCDRAQFFEEYTDENAEYSLQQKGCTVEFKDGTAMSGSQFMILQQRAIESRFNGGGGNINNDDGDDDDDNNNDDDELADGRMSMVSTEDGMGGDDDNNDDGVVASPQQLTGNSSADLLAAALAQSPAGEELDAKDPVTHPRLWRVTHIVGLQFLQDFYSALSNPAIAAQYTTVTQLFAFAATIGGGLLGCTLSPQGAELKVTNIFPIIQPYSAHQVPPIEAQCVIPTQYTNGEGIIHPMIITGGQDGRICAINTATDQERLKATNPALFSQLVKDIANLANSGKCKTGKSTNNNSKSAQSSMFSIEEVGTNKDQKHDAFMAKPKRNYQQNRNKPGNKQ